jgi:hypothetical protein
VSPDGWSRRIARRKERLLLAAALVVGALVVWASLSGWLTMQPWGERVSTREVGSPDAVEPLTLPEVAAVWKEDGGNPFGAPGAGVQAGGTARLRPPPLPPLEPVLPPPPTPGPLDLFGEAAQ